MLERFKRKRVSNSAKIFYVSLQRCGTKSFGEFFKRNGYQVASWQFANKQQWGRKYFDGRYREIITSKAFRSHDVFEDGPWFQPELMKLVSQEVPNSTFVYFHRPADDWFQSMLSHTNGRTLGDTLRHCHLYDRLDEYYAAVDANTLSEDGRLPLVGNEAHYMQQHEKHRLKVRAFFESLPEQRYFYGELYDKEKYQRLNDKLKLGLTQLDDVHVHRS